MIKRRSCPLILHTVLVSLAISAAPVHADLEGTLNLYLNGGYYWFDSDRLDGTPFQGLEPEDTWGGGFGFGYNVTDRWALEGVYHVFTVSVEGIDEKLDGSNYHMDLLYQFAGRFCGNLCWQPYVAFGVGEFRVDFDEDDLLVWDEYLLDPFLDKDYDRQTMVNLGLGVKYQLGPRWQARADARAFQGIEEGGLDGHISLSIGYQWVEDLVILRDRDADGVLDDADYCPQTPIGVDVGLDGCPVDSDRDGVPNYLDICPTTPLGTPVYEDGCPQLWTE